MKNSPTGAAIRKYERLITALLSTFVRDSGVLLELLVLPLKPSCLFQGCFGHSMSREIEIRSSSEDMHDEHRQEQTRVM